MMSLCGNLVVLLLFLPLLHSRLFTHAASVSPPISRPPIIFMTGLGSDSNYEDDEYSDSNSSPPEVVNSVRTTLLQGKPRFCDYNSCLENQEPCAQISKKTGCLCPGFSGADISPHAPRIHLLQPISKGENSGKVEVQWCSPLSVVSKYRVVIQGNEDDALEFQAASRRGLIGSLEAGTKVCVEAVNNAGPSTPSEFSCMRYDPPESSDRTLLASIVGGGIALLVILIIVGVILWKYQMCQKAKRDSTNGLGNPSYSTEGTL